MVDNAGDNDCIVWESGSQGWRAWLSHQYGLSYIGKDGKLERRCENCGKIEEVDRAITNRKKR